MGKRIIKVTEQQLMETEGDAFGLIDADNDYKPYNGQSEISVAGDLDGQIPGEPVTGDYVAKQLTPQSYNRYRAYGNTFPRSVKESADFSSVDKRNAEMDILSDDDDANNTTRISNTVESKLSMLISAMQKLRPKQVAMCLNKIIESTDLSQLPISWRKDLYAKINIASTHKEEK